MHATHLRHLIVWPIAATALLVAKGASADDSDPAAIEQRLKALETTPETQSLVREPAANARRALKRVLDARAAGDAAHAVELAAFADDWVRLAANVVRAAGLERELAAEHGKLTELEQKRRRTETLLEATIAQRERSREELARLKAKKSRDGQPSLPTTTWEAKPRDSSAARAPTKAKPTTVKAPSAAKVGAPTQVKP